MENKTQCMIMPLTKKTCLSSLFSPHLVSASTALWLLNPLAVFRVNFVMTNLQCLHLTVLTVVLSSVFVLYQFLVEFQTSARPTPGCPCGYPFFHFSIAFWKAAYWKQPVWQAVMVAKGFLPSTLFVLQKPCSFLQWIREFWVWHWC